MSASLISKLALSLSLSLSLLALPVAANAQAIVDIELGEIRTEKAGGPVNLYRFVGSSGTTLKATLIAPGSAALILYTPNGEEMLSARGDVSVTLEAILPLWDVFFIAVVRKDVTKPYVLALSGDQPDTALALFSHEVGFAGDYAPTCWDVPGVTKWRTTTTGKDVSTLVEGGYMLHLYGSDGRSLASPLRTGVSIDGDVVTLAGPHGKPVQYKISELIGRNPGQFTGYHCEK